MLATMRANRGNRCGCPFAWQGGTACVAAPAGGWPFCAATDGSSGRQFLAFDCFNKFNFGYLLMMAIIASCSIATPPGATMIKTTTFAICHFTVAFTVAYLLTGSFGMASLLALVEPMVNTVAYYFHEKVWDRIRARRGHEPNTAPAGHNGFVHHH